MNKRHARSGFMLVELIACLALMAVLSLLVTEMTATSLRMVRQTQDRDTMIHRIDTAVAALRRDTWQATAIRTTAHEVTLVQPNGVVRWRVEPEGKLVRFQESPSADTRTWVGMPDMTFAAEGNLLQVEVKSGPDGARREHVTLASQLPPAGGGQ